MFAVPGFGHASAAAAGLGICQTRSEAHFPPRAFALLRISIGPMA